MLLELEIRRIPKLLVQISPVNTLLVSITSSRPLQDMSSRPLQDMSSRRPEEVFSVTIFLTCIVVLYSSSYIYEQKCTVLFYLNKLDMVELQCAWLHECLIRHKKFSLHHNFFISQCYYL